MQILEIESLKVRDTKTGYNVIRAINAPSWAVEGVAIRYGNAFGEGIVDIFRVTFAHTTEGSVLTASAATTLQFFVPCDWENIENVPLFAYDGRYDDTPKAGLGGTLAQVLRRGNGVVILTHLDNVRAAASWDEAAKEIEY